MSCLSKERRLHTGCEGSDRGSFKPEEARMNLRRIEEGFGNKILVMMTCDKNELFINTRMVISHNNKGSFETGGSNPCDFTLPMDHIGTPSD